MVVPLGPGLDPPNVAVPTVVKESYSKYWWGVVVLFASLAVAEAVSGDVFATLFMCIMGGFCYFMVTDGCKNMSQYCLLLFGIMSCFQFLLEFITLCAHIGGRRSSETAVTHGEDGKLTYTTTVTTHKFFDPKMGGRYNLQSCCMIASPIMMALSGAISYFSYNAYSSSLFPDEDESFGGSSGGAAGYGGAGNARMGYMGGMGGGGGRYQQSPPQQSWQTQSTGPSLFQGTGQRLGG
eukprot:TRINITY_DN63645_c0_g1_i1.p1 TRINITY_DN63645_c0_g1~~TRINITY_DN63645_c0_g1_i1.p1  ORF type:complete len:237 (+),score=50.22 TRINITY_DN63645_c0_g1_i1:95-805(+)